MCWAGTLGATTVSLGRRPQSSGAAEGAASVAYHGAQHLISQGVPFDIAVAEAQLAGQAFYLNATGHAPHQLPALSPEMLGAIRAGCGTLGVLGSAALILGGGPVGAAIGIAGLMLSADHIGTGIAEVEASMVLDTAYNRDFLQGELGLSEDAAGWAEFGTNAAVGLAEIGLGILQGLRTAARETAEQAAAARSAIPCPEQAMRGGKGGPGGSGPDGPGGGGCGGANQSPRVSPDKQGKHIPGSKNFEPGRSTLSESVDAQSLVDEFAGTGQPVGPVARGEPGFRERIDAGRVIGVFRTKEGVEMETTKFIIHYAADNVHIVPAAP